MSTYAFSYSYDAAGNRVKQVKDGVPTFYHYDAANQLVTQHEDGTTSTVHSYEYDENGSLVHDSKVETSGKVLLDCQYEGTTDGADGETATESGTIIYEKGELPGTKAVRVAVDGGGTGTISYGATGCLADIVRERFGDTPNYVEPCVGSMSLASRRKRQVASSYMSFFLTEVLNLQSKSPSVFWSRKAAAFVRRAMRRSFLILSSSCRGLGHSPILDLTISGDRIR